MSPRGIVEAALAKNLDIIAICDHNTAENVAAAFRAAERIGRLKVLAGLEVSSAEEVHVLTLFDSPETAEDMQALVYDHLPPRTNRPEVFGEQVMANEDDEVEGFNERLLIGATDLDLNTVVEEAHKRGGLAIASHVDRQSFSLLGQLGFVPEGLALDGFEISAFADLEQILSQYPELANRPILKNSDAHFVDDIGSAFTEFYLAKPDLAEIKMALKNENGRTINKIFSRRS